MGSSGPIGYSKKMFMKVVGSVGGTRIAGPVGGKGDVWARLGDRNGAAVAPGVFHERFAGLHGLHQR